MEAQAEAMEAEIPPTLTTNIPTPLLAVVPLPLKALAMDRIPTNPLNLILRLLNLETCFRRLLLKTLLLTVLNKDPPDMTLTSDLKAVTTKPPLLFNINKRLRPNRSLTMIRS